MSAGSMDALVDVLRRYIHEIVIVDDNSTDRTAAVTREAACSASRA